MSEDVPTKGNYFALDTQHWFVELSRSSASLFTFPCGCLAITTNLFFLRLSTLLIHRICARLHGRAYICPRSACVTTSPSHSCAKPQLRNWGSEWWRTWSIPGLLGQEFVEEWETPWTFSMSLRGELWPRRLDGEPGWLWGHVWVTVVGSVCVRVCVACIILTCGAFVVGSLYFPHVVRLKLQVELIFISSHHDFFQLIYLIVQSMKHQNVFENAHQKFWEPRWHLYLTYFIYYNKNKTTFL